MRQITDAGHDARADGTLLHGTNQWAELLLSLLDGNGFLSVDKGLTVEAQGGLGFELGDKFNTYSLQTLNNSWFSLVSCDSHELASTDFKFSLR